MPVLLSHRVSSQNKDLKTEKLRVSFLVVSFARVRTPLNNSVERNIKTPFGGAGVVNEK